VIIHPAIAPLVAQFYVPVIVDDPPDVAVWLYAVV
jgi:hypothetical protein